MHSSAVLFFRLAMEMGNTGNKEQPHQTWIISFLDLLAQSLNNVF